MSHPYRVLVQVAFLLFAPLLGCVKWHQKTTLSDLLSFILLIEGRVLINPAFNYFLKLNYSLND
jgi:hypothetical protein